MNNVQSEVLAKLLQQLVDSRKWSSLLVTINRLVNTPDAPIDRQSGLVRELVTYGRKHPDEWIKLVRFVHRIKNYDTDLETLMEYRGEEINKAVERLYSNERPRRIISAIETFATSNDPDKKKSSYFRKDDGLQILKVIACSNIESFRNLVAGAAFMQDLHRRLYTKKLVAAKKTRIERITAALTLINHFRREPTEDEVNSAYDQLTRDRDTFMRHAVKAGRTSRKAIAYYWEKVDAELESIEKLYYAHKGGAKVNMQMISLPRLRFRDDMVF